MTMVANPSPSKRRALIKAGKWDKSDPVAQLVKPHPSPVPPPKRFPCQCGCCCGNEFRR